MKRLISLILVLVTVLSCVGPMAGCQANPEKGSITMGQWLSLVVDAFGIVDYTEEEPFFKKVESSSQYFSVFQAAAEWEIVNSEDDLTAEQKVTWNDVLISLVNAGTFMPADASDDDKVAYAIEHFDSSIRTYWGDRKITLGEAVTLLDTAQDQWVNRTYTENVQEIEYSEEVVDYSDEEVEYSISNDVVTASGDLLGGLQIGDVYVLPGNDETSAGIYRVGAIEVVDGQVIVTNDETFTEEEALEHIGDMVIQETVDPDFETFTGIYDENGNPIEYTVMDADETIGLSSNGDEGKVMLLGGATNKGSYEQLGVFDNVKAKMAFKVKGYTFALSFAKNNVGIEFSKEIGKTEAGSKGQTVEIFGKVSFSDVSLTRDIDYGVIKGLKSATVKVDYTTTVEGGVKAEIEDKVGMPGDRNGSVVNTLQGIISDYKNALGNLTEPLSGDAIGDEFYICSIPLVEGGFASVNFIIKGKVTAEGELKIVLEIDGSQGVEYKNGKLRYIKKKDVDVDFVAEAKLEITICFGFEITILKKIALIDLTLDVGMGVTASRTTHLFDAAGHEIFSIEASMTTAASDALTDEIWTTSSEDILALAESMNMTWSDYKEGEAVILTPGVCFEWTLYPIVRVGIGGSTLVGKLAKQFKLSVSLEIVGSKTPLLTGHIDFPNNIATTLESDSFVNGAKALFGIGAECVYQYTPWDEVEETQPETTDTTETTEGSGADGGDTIVEGDFIMLSTMRVFLECGESEKIEVTTLPKGYSLSDLVIECDDTSIATVDKASMRVVAGEKEGTAQIVVRTKDGKYEAYCAVTVTASDSVDFEGLSSDGSVGKGNAQWY